MMSKVLSFALFLGSTLAQQTLYGQCGGIDWTGATTCVAGAYCDTVDVYYAQCTPGAATATATATGSVTATVTGSLITATARTQLAGINIAGFDFGCSTDGTCDLSDMDPPLPNLYGGNGPGQMLHFYDNDQLNIFRLPVAWQYLVSNVPGGPLNMTNMATYNELVQACLDTGSYCIVDIHNYARWNGSIIRQGGPTNEQFASLWSQIATYYKEVTRVWMGIMNEPHDLNVTLWGETVQAAVTAIREAGATTQYISLQGSDYQSAQAFLTDGSSEVLSLVTNPDGTTTNLIFDVHKYLDSDNSGTHLECVTNNTVDAFMPLAAWLRENGRQAILTETGGGNVESCYTYVCEELDYLDDNADVYMGYVGWAGGSFDSTFNLTLTPTETDGTWVDVPLVEACFAR